MGVEVPFDLLGVLYHQVCFCIFVMMTPDYEYPSYSMT